MHIEDCVQTGATVCISHFCPNGRTGKILSKTTRLDLVGFLCPTQHQLTVEELETNLMSLVIFITLNICSTCFEH